MNTGLLIRPIASNAVRITHYHGSPPAERPWLKDVLPDLSASMQNTTTLRVYQRDGLVCAGTERVSCFFSEAAAPELGLKTRRPYRYFDIPQTAFYMGNHKVDEGIRLTLTRQPGEVFYGWGEWFNAFAREGGTVELDIRNALFGEQETQTYSALPFFISSNGYGFLLLNAHRSRWQINETTLVIEADGPGADYLLFHGPSYKDILRAYTALSGRPPLLPRWAFGLWATSYPQGHQDTVLELVRRHREKEIPLDAVILDYHWEERFHNLQWRRSLIPDPQALVTGLQALGARLGLILTPFLNTRNRPLQKWLLNTFGHNVTRGVESDDERALTEFAEAKNKGYLAHENVRWWFGAGGMIDFTHPQAAAWFNEKLRPLYQQGVEFIKNDDGEDLPDDARLHNGMDGREAHNLYGFYYSRAIYNGKSEMNPKQARSLVYARSAWVGSQRFPALFLGDQKPTFDCIHRTIRAGLNLGMSGFAYWTADVFGLDGKTTPETHMRYAQWSLLSPVARYFVRPPEIDNTRFPWSHNASVEANFQKYAQLRYRLLPYFNTLAHESYLTGVPMLRPLVLEFQHDERLRAIDDQVMLGEHLLLCPIVTAGATSREIVLPGGEWHDFWSEQSWPGGQTIRYDAPLERMPILVRGGSILPMGPVLQHIPEGHQFEVLEYHAWGPYPSEGLFLDDDGWSTAYQRGAFSQTRIRAEKPGHILRIRVSGAQGNFEGQVEKRRVSLFLHHAGEALSASYNGAPLPVSNRPGLIQVDFVNDVKKDAIVEIVLKEDA